LLDRERCREVIMDSFWVTEAMNGFGMTVEVSKVLYRNQSKFQKIEVYETVKLGRLLLLDGIIQLTGFDEFAYHEMMAHVPMFAHELPRRALVIGGGDGGVLRELAKHDTLEVMDICEIDSEVISVAKEFLPEIACGYDDPRVKVHVGDGSEFIKDVKDYYDVIIVDSTDPGGPGEPLFNEAFYRGMKRALRPGGIIASQSESPYLLPGIVQRLNRICRANFKNVDYGMIYVPTYPTGTIGVCCASDEAVPNVPSREVPPELRGLLRYYSSEAHTGAFLTPQFVKEMIF